MREQELLLGHAKLHVVQGDIFEAPVESVVNSENASFLLARPGHHSISGQLAERYGPELQEELHEQTLGEIMPLGTVIETGGYGDYECIFHAGHHSPFLWNANDLTEDEKSEHFSVLRECIRKILQRFGSSEIESIAFPLLGCGSFRLDPWLLTYEFMSELVRHVGHERFSGKEIWLVIYQPDIYPDVLNAALQALSDLSPAQVPWPSFELGVEYLDLFEEKQASRSRHPTWAAWMLTRYSELLVGYLFYQLACLPQLQRQPEDVMLSGRPASFGSVRTEACRMATQLREMPHLDTWVKAVSQAICSDHKDKQRLKKLNEDRNNIAHGRKARSFKRVAADLRGFIGEAGIRELIREDLMPPEDSLLPWTYTVDESNLGILERWTEHKLTYLIPHSGETIKVTQKG